MPAFFFCEAVRVSWAVRVINEPTTIFHSVKTRCVQRATNTVGQHPEYKTQYCPASSFYI